jgi:hypothetical protein
MRNLILLFVHIVATSIRLVRPGGVRSVLAESVLLKHQLVILNRSRRAPNLRASDRLIAGLCALLILPRRLVRSAVVVKPSTLLNFHRALVHRKYRLLFSPKHRAKPGPKGPSPTSKPHYGPIAATRGCIVKRIGLLSGNSESVFAVVPSGAQVRVCSESPVEDRFSALRAANWVTSGSGSCIVVHRLDGFFPSRRMPTEADLTALHQST